MSEKRYRASKSDVEYLLEGLNDLQTLIETLSRVFGNSYEGIAMLEMVSAEARKDVKHEIEEIGEKRNPEGFDRHLREAAADRFKNAFNDEMTRLKLRSVPLVQEVAYSDLSCCMEAHLWLFKGSSEYWWQGPATAVLNLIAGIPTDSQNRGKALLDVLKPFLVKETK